MRGTRPGGFCICPKCGYKTPHKAGTPCIEQKCPKCGKRLTRESSSCYEQIKKRKGGE